MQADQPILIAGGGIGGLTAALALGQKGIAVRVLEQSPIFGAIGYGIQLGPNVFAMLARLGLGAAVLAKAHLPPAILMIDARNGAEIIRIPTTEDFRRRFAHPYVVIHRVDLHDILLQACRAIPAIDLCGGTTLVDFQDDGTQVQIQTATNETIAGAALVAADGLQSRVRARLAPAADKPHPSGYAAHRTIVPSHLVPARLFRDEVILWGGEGFHIVCYKLRDGNFYNIVAVFRTATHAQKQAPAEYRQEVQAHYQSAHPDMQALLALMDLDRRWPISDRDPIRHWSRGRVTMLGDAAHATLQSLAQGAGMAIEDAVCLAECLARHDRNFVAAFAQYQQLRLIRTARVQLESRWLWEMYHCGDIAADVRNARFASWSAPEYFACLGWLYDAFPLPAETFAGTTPAGSVMPTARSRIA